MHERITFGKVDPARWEEFAQVWNQEVKPVLRAFPGNWRELMHQSDEEPGRIVYFSVWHEKKYADRFDALWGLDRALAALQRFFVEGPETRIFQTVGYHRPLVPLADKFK